ncbi:trimethylamine methyltransferase [Roseovarius sp. HI0049]|nr:trimethylamine methyltransferase [Roseovarius sp. HI0049]
MEQETRGRTSRRRRARDGGGDTPKRKVNYRQLRNPFPQMAIFSDDQIAAMHESALQMLEELGIKVLLPEARQILARAGARVDESTQMVHIGRDIVEQALATAPKSITARAAVRERDLTLELGALTFQCGAGAPHATDLDRGRRPGTGRDFREFTKIVQHYDVLHMMPPVVEPQDIATNIRHYFTMEAQLSLSDKLPFVFARGTPQVSESFELLRDFRGLTDDEFQTDPHCYTVINTNSPRVIDTPMAQGLIDFARHRQLSIVTPFTLMGAMAPITVAGAVTLSHAEALAAITLTQMTNPGAPVMYGTFTSNVDMKSGAPAFGTPEHFKASLAAGQMARLIGLPWRCAGGSAANVNDAQAANETQFGLWGSLLAGATTIIHSAGWLEGGLTVSYEKIITDLEVLQMVAEMCAPTPAGPEEIALDAHDEVAPSGHFFGCAHTMARYQTQFYQPLVADWSNYGTWEENGSRTASERATGIWKKILHDDVRPPVDEAKVEALHRDIDRRTAKGGAQPES